MRRRQLRIKYKKQRCLLSDVLPYEIPISFSNRFFYEFVVRNRISVENNYLIWKRDSHILDEIVHLLFGLPTNPERLEDKDVLLGSRKVKFRQYRLGGKSKPKPSNFKVPFVYRIRHKEKEFRELCVPHPLSQLKVVEFYDRCKELILYYSTISSFSIRAPAKLARFVYFRDDLHRRRLATDSPTVEEFSKEYENLKSFFVYWQYSNIYKFYESYRYHRCEKKYNKLTKLDISKCFDSIYTHSIGWAILGKERQKLSLQVSRGTFSDRFDKLMRQMNGGETNGIIIGPEFSRIFAEIILQAIDRELEYNLANREKPLRNRIDYEIFRYVDDYFIFYNEESDRKSIVDQLQICLKRYKLYLNLSKEAKYEKPLITELTIAKRKIRELLRPGVCFYFPKVDSDDGQEVQSASIQSNVNSMITSFKSIIWECGVAYKDVLNYTLAVIEQRCEREFKRLTSLPPEALSDRQVARALSSLIEFAFFIYSVSPRVNTTIRLCLIFRSIHSFLKVRKIARDSLELIYKQLYDNICFILGKAKSEEQTQVETLYLLVALAELGNDYWLEEKVLADYLGVSLEKFNGENRRRARSMNYFTISVALFYMKDKVRYDKLRREIIGAAINKIRQHSETKDQEAELAYLLFDLVSCPYVLETEKMQVLNLFGVSDRRLASEIVQYMEIGGDRRGWFTNWSSNFDFGKELYAKRSFEVY